MKKHRDRSAAAELFRRNAEEARLQLTASVFTHAQEGIMIMDADGIIIEVNRSFSYITGYDREEAIGQSVKILGSGCQEPEFYAKMWLDLEAKGHWYGEIWGRRKNSELYAAMLKITAVPDAVGKSQHYVALLSDITAFKEQQAKLEHLAHYDALTGLPNRVLLADRLKHSMAQSRRRENFMALIYLDLDGFKTINDTHGHEIGDEMLIVVAQRLKEVLREGDTLARVGGDEFVAVLADLSSTAECEIILSRLLAAAAAPVHSRGHVLTVSASIGVTLSPNDSGEADVLLRHADQAMYLAKQGGRNRYHLFDPKFDLHAMAHRESLQRIALAVDRREFVLHFEPKVNMRTGTVIGVEALIRWKHPERGLLPPDNFLPVAENHEVVSRLGDWVLDAALDQMAVWRRAGLTLPVSVNIAAHHLQQVDFLSRLREKLGSHPDVRPEHLELEVIETAALADISRTSKVINACQALGVGFSLDDFGTGNSSLTYLRRLPVTTIKIDRSLVRNMLWDREDMAIVEGVIGLALAFGRQVIAEGVETPDHAKLLLHLGCDLGQGSAISTPLPPQAVPGWVSQWRPEPQWADFLYTPLNRDNQPLIYAEVDHRQLVRQLENLLAEKMDTMPAIDVRNCQLGTWIAHEGTTDFGHLPELHTLDRLHERFHALAQEIMLAQSAGGSERVLPRLDEVRALRDDLIDHMHMLAAAIGRTVSNKAIHSNTANETGC
jgi:diguanylate cyclase (GGDEF)-like protein/PAS domain S-box-containing protein